MIFILLPSSIFIYLEFQSSIIPTPPPLLKLQFQYMEYSGPYAFFNMTESAYDHVKPWRNANKNIFTKVEQVLTLHMRYSKLTPGSTVGGIRVSVYEDHHSPVLIQRVGDSDDLLTHKWPFQSISLNEDKTQYSLYRVDRRFHGWRDIVGKSYSKSVPFVGSEIGIRSLAGPGLSLMDFFLPEWMLNVFVPSGIREILSIDNLRALLGRNEQYKLNDVRNNKYMQTMSLLESFGDFSSLPSASFSTGFVLFEGELDMDDFKHTSLLVEMDLDDIFVIESYIKIDYVLRGIRWWVYWWPGLCLFVGSGSIWLISCASCLAMSYFGIYGWHLLLWFWGTQKRENTTSIVKRRN
jgi:hypothetical protein